VRLLILSRAADEFGTILVQAGLDPGSVVEGDLVRAMERVEEQGWDLVLIDAALAGGAALDLVEPLAVSGQPVAVAAERPTLPLTLRVLRSGALDLLPFPPDPGRLRDLVDQVRGHGQPLGAAEPGAEWVGASPALVAAFRSASRLAGSDLPVLIRGERGTGKELLARIIHRAGPRCDGPFAVINCGAVSDAVLESELFGHERGSMAGAFGRRVGRFVKAAGGTVLLDELDQVSTRLQAKVLRAVHSGVVEPLGADGAETVDVRLIVTVDQDPAELVRDEVLLPDFHDALVGGEIFVPPLRERGEADLKLLVEHFVRESADRYDRTVNAVAPDAWEVLLRYPWPGNVRQLRGAVERAVLESTTGVLTAEHLPPDLRRSAERMPSEQSLLLEDLEKRHIVRVLELAGGHFGRAASLLGVHRNTLRRKLKSYGIET